MRGEAPIETIESTFCFAQAGIHGCDMEGGGGICACQCGQDAACFYGTAGFGVRITEVAHNPRVAGPFGIDRLQPCHGFGITPLGCVGGCQIGAGAEGFGIQFKALLKLLPRSRELAAHQVSAPQFRDQVPGNGVQTGGITQLLDGLLVASSGIQTQLGIRVPGSDIGGIELECPMEFALSAG
jgi:hypothetical protein